jgi:hypothetical protein
VVLDGIGWYWGHFSTIMVLGTWYWGHFSTIKKNLINKYGVGDLLNNLVSNKYFMRTLKINKKLELIVIIKF